jgi:glycosyltransferase involved in cell wall biosynthesis
MGRLDPQKGFDLLLHAFSKVASDFPGVSLVIMGEGPERANLETLAANLSLQTRATMPGRVGNPWPVLSHCDVFVLSSRFEGFPNALLEAMALGSAVISFNCPSGPAEMIRDGVNGLLVEPENPDALATAMAQLLNDDVLRNRLAEAAGSDRERYSISRITDQWENLCRTRF